MADMEHASYLLFLGLRACVDIYEDKCAYIDTYTLRKNTVLHIISKAVQNASRPKILCVSMSEMEREGLTIFIRALARAWKAPMNGANVLFPFWLLLCRRLESKWDSNDKNNFLSCEASARLHFQINVQLTFTHWSATFLCLIIILLLFILLIC